MKPIVVLMGSVALTGFADEALDLKLAVRQAVDQFLAEREVLDEFRWADAVGIPGRYWERVGIRAPSMIPVLLVDASEVLQEAEDRPIPTAPPKEAS